MMSSSHVMKVLRVDGCRRLLLLMQRHLVVVRQLLRMLHHVLLRVLHHDGIISLLHVVGSCCGKLNLALLLVHMLVIVHVGG